MAVVTGASDLYPALGGTTPDPAKARGNLRIARFTINNQASDNALSKYKVATIPADAILDESTILKVDGWGFATLNLGIIGAIAALATVTRATGTYWSPVAVGDAKHGLPAWQALGLAAAPANGLIDLYLQGPADATGAGVVKGKIAYSFRD